MNVVAANDDRGFDLRSDQDLVAAEDACPICAERETDRLIWIDDEHVRCQRCNAVYSPGGGQGGHDDEA